MVAVSDAHWLLQLRSAPLPRPRAIESIDQPVGSETSVTSPRAARANLIAKDVRRRSKVLSSPLGSIANKLPPSFASAPTAKTTNKAQKKLIDNVPAATGQRVVTLTLPLALPPGPLCHTHAAVSAPAFRPGRYGAPGEGARAVHVSDRVYTCRTWSAGCTKAGMTSWPAAVATATPSGQAYAGSTLREPHAGAVITSTPPQRAFRQQRGMRRKATESEPAEPQAKWYRVTAAADRRDPSDTTGSKPTATPAAVPAATPPMTTTHEQLQQYLPAPRRGRPPKHQVFAVSEEERKRRRQHSNRLSARRSYYRRLCKIEKLQEANTALKQSLSTASAKVEALSAFINFHGFDQKGPLRSDESANSDQCASADADECAR